LLRRSNPWPSLVDLFSGLLIVTLGGLLWNSRSDDRCKQELDACKKELLRATNRIDSLNARITLLEGLRSHMKPSCAEKQTNFTPLPSPLFSAAITGANTYVTADGKSRLISEVPVDWAKQLAEAGKNGCKYEIETYQRPNSSLNGNDYDTAVREFRKYFYMSMLPPH
jgi:hypothetical protein